MTRLSRLIVSLDKYIDPNIMNRTKAMNTERKMGK
jgi:hypothetical protein